MGYGTRNNGIRTFWPDDTEDEFYIEHSADLNEIMFSAEQKWPGILPNNIRIESEHIQTDCLPYHRYDGSDWTNFLKISKIN